MLEAIWAHAKEEVRKGQEERRNEREAEEQKRIDVLRRRVYPDPNAVNDEDLNLPRAA